MHFLIKRFFIRIAQERVVRGHSDDGACDWEFVNDWRIEWAKGEEEPTRRKGSTRRGEAIQNRKHQLWSFSKVLLLTADNNISATFDRRKEETINQRFLDRRLPIQYKHPYITDPGGKTRSIFQRVRKCRSSFQCLTPGTRVGNNPSKYVGQDTIVHYGKCTQSKSLNHTWSLLSIPCP